MWSPLYECCLNSLGKLHRKTNPPPVGVGSGTLVHRLSLLSSLLRRTGAENPYNQIK
jgi:hypothetical protein